MEKKNFIKSQLTGIVNAYENNSNKNNNNNSNNKNQENEFFSSEDSEGEYIPPSILSRRKSLLRKGIRKHSIKVDSNNIDILPDKREKNLNSMVQLRRKHMLKNNKLKNQKIGWNLVYDLLFCDYFNEMKNKKENFNLENEFLFNMKEIQLRIKKINNIIKYKEKNNKKNSFINFEIPPYINQEISFPEANWEDKSFYSIINEFKINDKERSNYIPKFITAYQNFQDYEKDFDADKNDKKNKNNANQFIKYVPKNSSTTLLPTNENFSALKKTSNFAKKRMSVTIKTKLNQIFDFNLINNNSHNNNSGNNLNYNNENVEELKINKNLNKLYSPVRAIAKRKSNKKNTKSNTKNNMFKINIDYDDNNFYENNVNKFKYGEKYDLISKNKKFAEYLIRNYSNYEEDITNIQNNFLVYDIELTKNEKMFKNKSNELIKHFFDLHIDNTEIGNKIVFLPERLIKRKKKIDEFVNKFNEIMMK